MKKVRKIGLLCLLVAALFAVSGCAVTKIREIRVTSVGVKYIVPTSTRSLDGVLLLGIDNPSISFTAQDVQGVVKSYGREIAHFTAGQLPVQARSAQVYELPCTATLMDRVSLLDLLAIASKRSLEGMTVDVKLRVSLKGGKGTTLTFNGLDLAQFIHLRAARLHRQLAGGKMGDLSSVALHHPLHVLRREGNGRIVDSQQEDTVQGTGRCGHDVFYTHGRHPDLADLGDRAAGNREQSGNEKA